MRTVSEPVANELKERFQPDIDQRTNKFIWLGTHRILDAFTFIFVDTPAGWIQAHAYRFDDGSPVWDKAVLEIDLSDGILDGRVRRPALECSACNRKIPRRFNRCMYCGVDIEQDLFS